MLWSAFTIIYKKEKLYFYYIESLTTCKNTSRKIFYQVFTVRKWTWGSTWHYLSFVLNFWGTLARRRNIRQVSWPTSAQKIYDTHYRSFLSIYIVVKTNKNCAPTLFIVNDTVPLIVFSKNIKFCHFLWTERFIATIKLKVKQ